MEEAAKNLNVERTDAIDGLAFDKETKSLILLLADGMDWSDENRHLFLLQEKLNSYILYIDTRQFEGKYPDVEKIELRVTFLFKEPDMCGYLLSRAEAVLNDNFDNVFLTVEHGTMSSD